MRRGKRGGEGAGGKKRRAVPSTRYTDFVQRRRDELCFLAWGAGFVLAWRLGSSGANLLTLDPPSLAVPAWLLLVAGVVLRIWAAASLEKNSFTRPHGPYLAVRHPLYLGTILISLAFFLSTGLVLAGTVLWAGLVASVFLPVVRKEERELSAWFPGTYPAYIRRVPRLVPDFLAFAKSLSPSGVSAGRAGRNFGLRALWFIPLVPSLGLLLGILQRWWPALPRP
jgi:protein-S-isoprenylcysteine O-methyltransferase Ste14